MRTDRRTDMAKLIVAFCNFADVPKNGLHLSVLQRFKSNVSPSFLK
jgi:hypothetical protein